MNFLEIARTRQSCRNYDAAREVEEDKLSRILECARLSPSACNAQPYQITVLKGNAAREGAKAVQGMGMNKFATDVPVFFVLSEMPYNASAAVGAKIKKNDFRSIDIGILSAYITAAAAAEGLGSCILGWLDDGKLREICGISGAARLVIAIGYPKDGDPLRNKVRKDEKELYKIVE